MWQEQHFRDICLARGKVKPPRHFSRKHAIRVAGAALWNTGFHLVWQALHFSDVCAASRKFKQPNDTPIWLFEFCPGVVGIHFVWQAQHFKQGGVNVCGRRNTLATYVPHAGAAAAKSNTKTFVPKAGNPRARRSKLEQRVSFGVAGTVL